MRVLLAILLAVIASPALAFEPSAWLDRCLASWVRGPVNTVSSEWASPGNCTINALDTCRFTANPETCLGALDVAINAKLETARKSLPSSVEGDALKSKSLRNYLDYARLIDREGAINPTQTMINYGDLEWLGDDLQGYFIDQIWRMTALMTAQARFEVDALNTGQAASFTDLDACLTDPSRVATVFTERYRHEVCAPLATCDPKLVTSAKVIATRNCRQDAIAACADNQCLNGLTDRWSRITEANNVAIRAEIAQLNLNALPPLAVRRIETYDTAPPTCPKNRYLLSSVLGDAGLEARACDLFVILTSLEQTEAMTRYLSSVSPE